MRRAFHAILAAVFLALAIVFIWAFIGASPESGERGDAAQVASIIMTVFCFLMAAVFGWRALWGGRGNRGE